MAAESVTSRQNEPRSLLAVDIQGNQCGGFCMPPLLRQKSSMQRSFVAIFAEKTECILTAKVGLIYVH